ncbi:hypothetical protein OSH17_12705 [Acinetobacter baumannii]|uniref:hypothetical protein n=1 Tax=Acinetobacter baumannii TaxID=470 RepID=UPI00144A6EC9|nr:hypothetical protein [Acinetobacter baumannii]NLP55284.1 hypothetical protein [Acinetobacter baumannii]NQE74111.1 hypothetical protein [Acinetobacter baumannii]QNT87682.1 hypothetical protein H0N27_12625 [Acinetobacter baumannii]WEX34669.1 hypothetical protein OSH13_04875 [Acinetobacter baumannii]WEX38043.1 hypothetical protein OSH14_04875 [Acinetobacter baumannii]
MIDLNQEIENFDAYFLKRHGELPLDPTSEEYANKSYLKHEMFKAWKARAKAQAVPEDWVIVPQELSLDMALKIAKERILEQPPVKDPVLNEILEKALKENLQYEQFRLIRDYKEMVKRLSESGAANE